jgi:hypothetical protein
MSLKLSAVKNKGNNNNNNTNNNNNNNNNNNAKFNSFLFLQVSGYR